MNTFQKLPLVCGPLFTKHVFNPPVYLLSYWMYGK